MNHALEVLQQYAGALVAISAAVVAIKVVTGGGPFKWLWDRLIHQPVREGLREVIVAEVSPFLRAVEAELTTNDGSSLRDAVNRLEKQGLILENQIDKVQEGVNEAQRTAVEVRHDLEASVLAAQHRLPDS